MPHPAFRLVRSHAIPNLNLTLEEYRHHSTRARHIHLAADDDNNAFLVAFLTVPTDSTGVAHILEHTTLCGSQRYPVRDPFFMMVRRSLNTFMNAFTSSDWTAYPFASQNRKDFDNLLQVYLDAVFFPLLHPLDFAQEGHRLEFEIPDSPSSPLLYKGIVFNEMKGSMSSPVRLLWSEMAAHLFPTVTYHYNSGGDPAEIPKLTYEQLKQFHATHYHPSNALFMTYGDLPAEHHQGYFDDCALKRFKTRELDFSIPDEQRYSEPQYRYACYPLDPEQDPKARTHIVVGWLLGCGTDPLEMMKAYLLNGVLLNNSSSPLQHALETSKLGTAPSPLCGLDSSSREMTFCCGLEGSETAHGKAVERLVLEVLEQVATDGVPQEAVESVLHQIELSQREITGDHFPYGLHLLVNTLSSTLHGGDPLSLLNLDPVLEQLRQEIQDPDFIKNLVRKMLLDNPHRVHLVMEPDTGMGERLASEEHERLAAVRAALGEDDKERIIEQAAQLEARQNTQDSPDLLPCVTLADVPETLKIAQGEHSHLADASPLSFYAQGTNGMVYQQIVLDLPELDPEMVDLLPLYCDCLTEVGLGQLSYLEAQAWQSAVTGGVGAHCSVRGEVGNAQQLLGHLVISGKSLARNQYALSEILYETFNAARFDELPRLRELITQMRTDAESNISSRGHNLTMRAAASSFSPGAALEERWNGFTAIKRIRALDQALHDDHKLAEFADKLLRLRNLLRQAPRRFLLISEEHHRAEFEASLRHYWQSTPEVNPGQAQFSYAAPRTSLRQGWTTSTQVNFCAKAYPVVPYSHPDAPVFSVLGHFLRNGYLHRNIREQGGAYGGGASYDPDSAIFKFYSYRDPRLEQTLLDFDQALVWLQEFHHEARALEESILGVVSQIDRPASPAGEARRAYYSELHGRTPELRRKYRHRVLNVSIDDLRRVGAQYLAPNQANVVVLSNPQVLGQKAAALGLELHSI